MLIKFNIPEYSIESEVTYRSDISDKYIKFPVLVIGRGSYIEEAIVEAVLDETCTYNIHIGRYSSLAGNINMIVDMNHDYKRVCQGRINGIKYSRPSLTRRKGQIVIMNDCWIGDGATIISGVTIGNGAVVAAESVVTKDVPSYAIVAGNPAKVIGYRFEPGQIQALNLIRWWNWTEEKVQEAAELLYGDVNIFIQKYLPEAAQQLEQISNVKICPMEKHFDGLDKRLLYIPDFEQEYPTYERVIQAFVSSYANSNYELLLYVKEDEYTQDKLDVLNNIFVQYEDVDCYINLYVGNIEDERGLFGQVDAYITNRSLDNIHHMDMADMFGIPCISSVDSPMFEERAMEKMVPVN